MTLRVMHVLAPARAGGLETVVTHLARGTAATGAAVHVAAVLPPQEAQGHPFVERARAYGLTVHVVVAESREYLAERAKLRTLLDQHDIQVVHTHGYRCDAVDGSLAKKLGKAHVTTLHGFTARTWRGHLYEWIQVQAACRAHHAIAVAPAIEERLKRAGADRVSLIRNGLDTDRELPSRAAMREQLGLSADALVVGWVGRLSFEKGPDLFLDAIRMLKNSGNEFNGLRFVVVGNGPMLEALRVQSADLPVDYLGERADARDLMCAFDILALTSRTEGTPMVVLEAMSANVPVLATSVGGVPDVLGDGHGELTDLSAAAIANGLRRLANGHERRSAIAERAGERVRTQFGLTQWVDRHLRVYGDVIEAAGAGRR